MRRVAEQSKEPTNKEMEEPIAPRHDADPSKGCHRIQRETEEQQWGEEEKKKRKEKAKEKETKKETHTRIGRERRARGKYELEEARIAESCRGR